MTGLLVLFAASSWCLEKMTRMRIQGVVIAAVLVPGALGLGAQPAPRHTQLVIVVDGLRPDYVTPAVMPRVYRLGQRGIVFTAHHSVFPTVTRVNAS